VGSFGVVLRIEMVRVQVPFWVSWLGVVILGLDLVVEI
jgi:hypothetical protein